MSKDTWERVEWSNEREFMNIVMDRMIYISKDDDKIFLLFNDLAVCTSAKWDLDMLDVEDFVLQGYGYIKKETEWFDVASKDSPMFVKSRKTGVIMIFNSDHHDQSKWEPATLKELESMTWECMKND